MRASPLLALASAALLALLSQAPASAAPVALGVETSPDGRTWTAVQITPGMITAAGKITLPDTGIRLAIGPVAGPPAGMVAIPGGTFSMGDSALQQSNAAVHSVTVSAFNIDAREVSKTVWDEVRTWAAANGYTDLPAGGGKAPNHPVQAISWYAAVKWCNARSEKDGRTPSYKIGAAVYRTGNDTSVALDLSANGYRLPTEAEWEYAARGGLASKLYPWGDTINATLANYEGNPTYTADGIEPFTSPIGAFAANGYGLFDMAGNVSEWCWDFYSPTYFSQPAAAGPNPVGPSNGPNRLYRGGDWLSPATSSRVAYRPGDGAPTADGPFIGFRTVCR
jgi:formylglycine-generating enzyme required for sulfatase activity